MNSQNDQFPVDLTGDEPQRKQNIPTNKRCGRFMYISLQEPFHCAGLPQLTPQSLEREKQKKEQTTTFKASTR